MFFVLLTRLGTRRVGKYANFLIALPLLGKKKSHLAPFLAEQLWLFYIYGPYAAVRFGQATRSSTMSEI